MKHLVIPDAHAKPNQDMRRFDWAGKLIVDRKPEKIICLGDFADMESLCSYDKGKKDYNARSYKRDIAASHEAMERLLAPLNAYNQHQREMKQKQYKPKMIMLYGNHEHRINRAIQFDHVMLEGLISLDDLKYEEYGWETYPFLERVDVDGILYSHYFITGVMGRPVGGEHPAATLIRKQLRSCTAGHSHVFDVAVRARGDGKQLRGLVAGCYLEEYEEYAGPANDLWRRGLYLKHNVADGDYDLEEISMNALKEMYG